MKYYLGTQLVAGNEPRGAVVELKFSQCKQNVAVCCLQSPQPARDSSLLEALTETVFVAVACHKGFLMCTEKGSTY